MATNKKGQISYDQLYLLKDHFRTLDANMRKEIKKSPILRRKFTGFFFLLEIKGIRFLTQVEIDGSARIDPLTRFCRDYPLFNWARADDRLTYIDVGYTFTPSKWHQFPRHPLDTAGTFIFWGPAMNALSRFGKLSTHTVNSWCHLRDLAGMSATHLAARATAGVVYMQAYMCEKSTTYNKFGIQRATTYTGKDLLTNSKAYANAVAMLQAIWTAKKPVSYGARVEYRMQFGAAKLAFQHSDALTRSFVKSRPFVCLPTKVVNQFKHVQLEDCIRVAEILYRIRNSELTNRSHIYATTYNYLAHRMRALVSRPNQDSETREANELFHINETVMRYGIPVMNFGWMGSINSCYTELLAGRQDSVMASTMGRAPSHNNRAMIMGLQYVSQELDWFIAKQVVTVSEATGIVTAFVELFNKEVVASLPSRVDLEQPRSSQDEASTGSISSVQHAICLWSIESVEKSYKLVAYHKQEMYSLQFDKIFPGKNLPLTTTSDSKEENVKRRGWNKDYLKYLKMITEKLSR